MGKTTIKAKKKPQIEKEVRDKAYAIKLSPQTIEGLRLISNATKKTQVGIIEEILEPLIMLAVSYERFTYDVYPSGNTLMIPFFGKSRIVSGSNNSEITNEAELFEVMVKKSMGIEPKKESEEAGNS
jgi:hypothetical protein